ncbi:MAG: bifunctional ornithine acetyltransferase/N-acetylglutamate synthase [Clostridiales bacterium]|jgi:glutamate N-acetyltransferase/amino-acid N-acetyltransferase|nr:bifunctional ornithine acetyltransferase/N-acetylglutamate synthase [Clostridiales bacterium]
MTEVQGGVTAPLGFKAAGVHAGVKKQKKDLAVLVSDVPAWAAGVFTQNIVKAAPVLWDERIIAAGRAVRGVVINSGNANACTGSRGDEDARKMAELLAGQISADPEEILVASTGMIGVCLPMPAIAEGILAAGKALAGGESDGLEAAEAIMTTDTFSKTAAVTVTIGGKRVTVGGMAKGSGMIHPNMATTLAFVTTDAAVARPLLRRALSDCAADTFNMISVDGDTSTNDTILVLANGMAGNPVVDTEDSGFEIFRQALLHVTRKLAVDVARDGEGATKLITVDVTGARAADDARKIARSVVASNLFKAAMFGADAGCGRGRALCAMGYSGGVFDPERVTIAFQSSQGEITLMTEGEPVEFDERLASKILSADDILVNIALVDGAAAATAWGCDLTYDYVKINADYRS